MRSLAQIKQNIVTDILALRTDVRFVEGDPQYDVIVNAPSQQFYRFEVLLEFESRTNNLTDFTTLINDTIFKATVAGALGAKEDGTPYTTTDVDELISSCLDAYVSDWGISRSSGSKATGSIRVYLSDTNPVEWNTATTFTSRSGISYVAIDSVPLVVPNYDNSTGLYYVDIPVIAATSGSNGNSVANSVKIMNPKPANFSSCINISAIDGGSSEENDLELIAQAEEAFARRNNGSLGGNEALAELQDYVDDAASFDEDDPDNDIYIGSVADVEAQFSSEDTSLKTDTQYWPGVSDDRVETFDFTLVNQPALDSVTPIAFKYTVAGVEVQIVPLAEKVEGAHTGANGSASLLDANATFITDGVTAGMDVFNITDGSHGRITFLTENTITATLSNGTGNVWNTDDEYEIPAVSVTIVKDTSAFARSNKANDVIRLTAPLPDDLYSSKIKLVYTYDKSPTKLQNVFDDKDNRMVGPSVLVKAAIAVPIQITVEPQISFGADITVVQNNITANILVFFNGGITTYGTQFSRKSLNQDIYWSDIQSVILNTENVVTFDNDTFRVLNTLIGVLEDPIIIKPNQYATLFNILFDFTEFNLANFTANTI